MLRQHAADLTFATRGRGLLEITDAVTDVIRASAIHTGLVTLHVCHTSASLVIQENADPDVRSDLDRFFARLVPDADPLFEHTAEGPDDMAAHVRSVLTAVNLSIPVREGRPTLGTWQGIYLWEHRHRSHRRRVAVHVLGESATSPAPSVG